MNVILITCFFWVEHTCTHPYLNIKKSAVILPICSLSPVMEQPPYLQKHLLNSWYWLGVEDTKKNKIQSFLQGNYKLVPLYPMNPKTTWKGWEEQSSTRTERNQNLQDVRDSEYWKKLSPENTLSLWLGEVDKPKERTNALGQREQQEQSIQWNAQNTWKPCLPKWFTCGSWLPRPRTPPESLTRTARRRGGLGCFIRIGHTWVEGRVGCMEQAAAVSFLAQRRMHCKGIWANECSVNCAKFKILGQKHFLYFPGDSG